MGKQRSNRGDRRHGHEVGLDDALVGQEAFQKPEPLSPRTESQRRFLDAIMGHDITFGVGPAGTGKTYLCAALAADLLAGKEIRKIILTRPAVEAGESLGFLPGEKEDKFAPYLTPFIDVFYERLGHGNTDYMVKRGRIEAAPLAYMRGRTFKDAVVILDEAQNTTPAQMKMFLTRIGENCRVIVNGDPTQKDIPGDSGLLDALHRLAWIPQVAVVRFKAGDVVRSGIVSDVIDSYSRACPAEGWRELNEGAEL